MGFALKKPQDVPGRSWPAILIGMFVAFGGILYGYDTGNISGILAIRYFKDQFSTGYMTIQDGKLQPDISSSQQSLIVSILSAGTFFGALAAAQIADRLGRRWSLIASSWVFVGGVILQCIATKLPMFISGRFFAGLGVGLISTLIPLYQSETAPKWIRGVIVGSYQLAITIGLLLAAVVDNATKDRNDSGSYRIPLGIQFVWAIILMTGIFLLPETPRYLIRVGNQKEAARALSKLRHLSVEHSSILEELEEISQIHAHETSLGKASYSDCVKGGIAKRLLTGCLLQGLQQLTGINFIFYYGTQYFKNSGITNPFVITMITSAVNVSSTLPGLYAIDKFGRRPLLLWGAVGMCIAQLFVAILGTTTTGQTSEGVVFTTNIVAQKVSIAFICLYIFFFASSWGPIVWVVTGEIFPFRVRAKALSITTAVNWLLNWAIAYSTPYLVNFGPGNLNLQSKIFFIWFGCCFFCIAFVWFFIYETKGLSLEQVDEMYNEVSIASKSVSWEPRTQQNNLVSGKDQAEEFKEKENRIEGGANGIIN
ncbi:putative glucose transporter rco-3 [Golovinomyces cichoracearum]|uniref:Putative glucose transporter rco-3 n=1 Tax=Golovinomyces cichoracearum TaxID=62708 RepID=A0A420I9D2_9PEZI|nr:putative glucose transporter rco-3 [Golovinomyces cichoracearum]